MADRRRRRPAPRSPRVDPARRAAFEVLRAVRVDGAYTNLVLPSVLRTAGLTGRDAGFATELASGAIRLRGRYDAILAACIDRPLKKVEAKVLDCLRLGAHQLLAMRVPDHAAISSTVDLVRDRAGGGAAGFANAVLRKVADADLETWLQRIGPDPAIVHSHPAWVVERLDRALTPDRGDLPADGGGKSSRSPELEALLAADNVPPAVTLVARPGLATLDELPGRPTAFSPYGVVLAGGDPGAVPAVAEERAGVQDEGSQLVAIAAAAAPVEGRDERWLDLCAGPGGKAALLAALATERGATLIANERQPHRARLVVRALGGPRWSSSESRRRRAPVETTAPDSPPPPPVVAADGTRPPFPPETFDRVLLDAPCTGLGALRRRPEARWRRSPADLAELVELQEQLLDSALSLVRAGGVVLYATCSPVLEETAGVVETVAGRRDDVRLEDAGPLLPQVSDADGPLPGTMQLWPHRHGTDAMFIALLRRLET